jgi:hypothetical protein
MHNQVLVRVLHGIADLTEESQPLLDRQLLLLAPFGDRNPRDVLQHDVGRAMFGGPTVEEPGDIRVLQVREDLPLVPESRHGRAAIQLEFERLDGDLLVELIVIADGETDRAHPPWPSGRTIRHGPMWRSIQLFALRRRLRHDTGKAARVAERGQQLPAQLLVRGAARR